MTEKKAIFRRVLDSMIDARTKQAERYVERYARQYGIESRSGN